MARAVPLKYLVKLVDAAEPFATRAVQHIAQALNPVVDAVNGMLPLSNLPSHHATHQPGGTDVITGIAPGAHHVTHEAGGSDGMAIDAIAATGSLRTLGTGGQQGCAGNDARLSDARIPMGSAGGDLAGTYPNPTLAAPPALKPAWASVIHGSVGEGDPVLHLSHWHQSAWWAPSPTEIGTTVARCVKYRSRYPLHAGRVRLFGIATTTGLYTFGLYKDTTLIYDMGAQNSAANTWLNITLNYNFVADADYWFCVSATGAGATAGFASPGSPLGTNFWKAGAAPLGGRSVQLPEYAQFAVTAGVFPATRPALAAAAYAGNSTGTIPFALFDSSTNDGL